jgi:cardiolipin synthase
MAVVRNGAWQGVPRGLSANAGLAAGVGRLSIPNLITLARILLVPVVVWAIASNQMLFAFLLFAAAGVSDAVDGFLAKRFGMASELGAYLDPLADKVLIVSIYVSLGIVDALPRWLVILVVSRDLLIVGGVLFSWLLGKPVSVKPHPVSKANTAAQLLLVGLVLAALGFRFDAGLALKLTTAAVAALTLASVAVYLREWVRHMGVNGIKR